MNALPIEETAQADLMAALLAASDALARLRAVETPDEYAEFNLWLHSLSEAERGFILVGLLSICWRCLDPAIDADYLLDMSIMLPPPSEAVPADMVRTGDWIRLKNEDGTTTSRQVTLAEVSGGDVTLLFENVAPIVVPRNTTVSRTAQPIRPEGNTDADQG